jgi:hypothetical protein
MTDLRNAKQKILIKKLQSNLGDINDTQRRGRTHEEKKNVKY